MQTYQERVTDAVRREATIIDEGVPVRLTDAEVLDISRKSAEMSRDAAYIETEKKEASLVFKGQIESLIKEIAYLQNIIRSGQEWRTVQCEKAMHYDIGQVTVTRLDTGHIIETRPMTREERQIRMDL